MGLANYRDSGGDSLLLYRSLAGNRAHGILFIFFRLEHYVYYEYCTQLVVVKILREGRSERGPV